MRKIAFFSGDITGCGGTERVAVVLANALAEQKKFEIHMISLTQANASAAFALSPQIATHILTKKTVRTPFGYLPLIFRLRSYVAEYGIDVLVDIDGVLDVLSLPVRLMCGVRVVSWEHFYYYDVRGTWYRRPIRRLSVHGADAIVTLTERDRDYYVEQGASPERVVAIHNPMYEPVSQVKRTLPDGKKVILSAGALSQIKGFAQVPQIAARIRQLEPSLDFVWQIAGEGVLREQITEEIRRLGVSRQVELLGQQSAGQMRELYAQAQLFVMTSDREGMPMVLLEAKQNGLPIVSYDIQTGPSEIISDGINGCLIPYHDASDADLSAMAAAIAGLLTDRARYDSFAAHTADLSGDFSLTRILDQWTQLLARLTDA